MSLPPDAEARLRALDPEHSYICEAPAGSGKTELLTQRFLTLLGRVRKPEEILAITFTRKATGEMRERVLAALRLAEQEKPEQPHRQLTWDLARQVQSRDAKYQWQLLYNPNRLQIKTFDSLCASLAQNLPMESTFGAMPQVTEDSEALYRKAVQTLLATLEDEVPWNQALVTVLTLLHNRFERFENLMVSLLAKREQWLPLIAYGADRETIRRSLEAALQRVWDDSVDMAHQLIPLSVQKRIVELAAFAAANLSQQSSTSVIGHCKNMELATSVLPGASPEEKPLWQGIITLLMTDKDQWRKTVNKTCGFPSGSNKQEKQVFAERKQALMALIGELQQNPLIADALLNLRYLPDNKLSVGQWHILDALFTLLPVLAAQLTIVFKETNSIDFVELSLGAHRALGGFDEPSQLAMKLDYRISHILVDEFQDTSASQVLLLNQLTAGWQPDDGRTLFCVGDAMQSIYGFRGANVGLFLNCREQGLENIPLEPLRLTANFRSQAGIVNWVNQIFKAAFPQQNNATTGAVCYSNSDPILPRHESNSVCVHGFVDHPNNVAEAQMVLDLIAETRADTPTATIAVLVRNRNHVADIVKLLKDAGMRYRAVELESLQEHIAVQDLMALTRALLHPADRTAWLSVLRAPWCGLTLVDLEKVANYRVDKLLSWPTVLQQCVLAADAKAHDLGKTGEQSDLFIENACPQQSAQQDEAGQSISRDGLLRLRRVLPVLISAQHNRERKTFRSWIEGCWLQLGGPACVENTAALENTSVFFRLLERWEYASDLKSFEILDQSVAKLYASPDPEADDTLQIMTIHKSKGLEFDVVIVPQLQRQPRSREKNLLMWQERLNAAGDSELVMAPLTMTSSGEQPPTYEYLRREEARRINYENCRLLYVACTRAKQQLHLSAQIAENPKTAGELKKPPASSLLATIWEPVQRHISRVYLSNDDVNQTRSIEKPSAKSVLSRLKKQWQFPAIKPENLLKSYIPPYQFSAAQNQVELQQHSRLPRCFGTTVHQYLQLIAEQGIEKWPVTKIQSLRAPLTLALRSAGGDVQTINTAADRAITTLQTIVGDQKGRWILSHKHPFAASEYPLTYTHRDGVVDLVIDRVITDSDGITWVIDFKTAEPSDDQSIDEFLIQQQDLYVKQLKIYRLAITLAGFSPVRTALYFPLLGQWLDVAIEE